MFINFPQITQLTFYLLKCERQSPCFLLHAHWKFRESTRKAKMAGKDSTMSLKPTNEQFQEVGNGFW